MDAAFLQTFSLMVIIFGASDNDVDDADIIMGDIVLTSVVVVSEDASSSIRKTLQSSSGRR